MPETNERKPKRLTGKQAAFVHKYLGQARFNASLAAQMAGYRATSKHSFEAIGSENLSKPEIRKTIDEYFKISRMSAEEVITELSILARGDSKDKVRALALLSSHYGILDGAGQRAMSGGTEIVVRYETRLPKKATQQEWSDLARRGTMRAADLTDDELAEIATSDPVGAAIEKVYGSRPVTNEERAERIHDILITAGKWHEEATEFNEAQKENNERIEGVWNKLRERFKDSPEVTEALSELHNAVHLNCATDPCLACVQKEAGNVSIEKPEGVEPEIIAPDHRLMPATVERMMREADANEAQQARESIVQEVSNARESVPEAMPVATATKPERVRTFGYCMPIDGDEVERIKERDRDRIYHRVF